MTVWSFIADLFTNLYRWSTSVLLGWGVSPFLSEVIIRTIGAFLMALFPLVLVILLIWESRKVIARMQNRLGPNNSVTTAGPYAIFQSVADAIKIFTKELIVPEGADKGVFYIAPMIVIADAIVLWSVIPLGPSGLQVVDLDIGVFFIVALASLAPFSMIMAGWSSRNKYADVGAFRAVSQIISYEIPQILGLLVPVMLSGSLSLQDIVYAQEVPYIFVVPVVAMIYLLASIAEVGRLPFELAEADSEIVAGYFTEYSGMMFGSFYVGEFVNSVTVSVLFSLLFLGGWRGPWVMDVPILGPVWLILKAFVVYNLLMLFWAAMPRLRIDQVLSFNWKFLVPLGLVLLIVVALVDKVMLAVGISQAWLRNAALFLTNILTYVGAVKLESWWRHRQKISNSPIDEGRGVV